MIKRFWKNRNGVALIEMALITPLLLTLFLGGYEVVRYLVILQKVDKATYALANITAQYVPATEHFYAGEISENELRSNVFPQVERVMEPYNDRNNFVAILSSMRNEGGSMVMKWQMGGGGSLGGASSIVNGSGPSDPPNAGLRNSATSLGGDLGSAMATSVEGENIVVSEVFYQYRPVMQQTLANFGIIIEPALIHRWLFLKPRQGDLICLPPTFLYQECLPVVVPPNGGGTGGGEGGGGDEGEPSCSGPPWALGCPCDTPGIPSCEERYGPSISCHADLGGCMLDYPDGWCPEPGNCGWTYTYGVGWSQS